MTIVAEVTKPGRWGAALAVLFIVLGIMAIGEPVVAGLAVALLVGWALIFGSLGHVIGVFTAGGVRRGIGQTLLGVVYFVAGMYFVTHPLLGLETLTLWLAIILAIEAVLEIVVYTQASEDAGGGWRLVNAAVTALLAIMIWRHWPSSSVWAIGTLVGVNLLITGVSRLMGGATGRRVRSAA